MPIITHMKDLSAMAMVKWWMLKSYFDIIFIISNPYNHQLSTMLHDCCLKKSCV